MPNISLTTQITVGPGPNEVPTNAIILGADNTFTGQNTFEDTVVVANDGPPGAIAQQWNGDGAFPGIAAVTNAEGLALVFRRISDGELRGSIGVENATFPLQVRATYGLQIQNNVSVEASFRVGSFQPSIFTGLLTTEGNGNLQLIPDGTGKIRLGPTAATSLFTAQEFGKATMAAGTTGAIADLPITAGSIVLVTPEFAPAGRLSYSISAGASFTIVSTDGGDAGSVSWMRIIP
jgi:hypothetical protein